MASPVIKVFGTTWCGDCKRAVRVLNDRKAQYEYIDIEQDDAAAEYVVQVNNGYQSVPTILFPDGSIMVEPSSAALAAKLTSLNGACQ
jgi:mycoredoxin